MKILLSNRIRDALLNDSFSVVPFFFAFSVRKVGGREDIECIVILVYRKGFVDSLEDFTRERTE